MDYTDEIISAVHNFISELVNIHSFYGANGKEQTRHIWSVSDVCLLQSDVSHPRNACFFSFK